MRFCFVFLPDQNLLESEGCVLLSFVFPKAPSKAACSLVGVHYIPVTSNGMNIIDFTFLKVDVIFSEILCIITLTNWPILSNISKIKKA